LSVTIASAFIFKNWLKEPSSQLPLGFALLLIIVIGVVLTSLSPIQKTNTKVIHGKTIVTINEQSKSNNLKF
jgi:glucose uptake protein GlcU